MDSIKIKNVVLGEGTPKICAPLVQTGYQALIKEAGEFSGLPVDVAEWRCDCYEGIMAQGTVIKVLPGLLDALGGLPLLFTFRTHKEGGTLPASGAAYRKLLEEAICSGYADMVDVELSFGHEAVRELAELAHAHSVKVILSNHDFHATPGNEELLSRLKQMEALGADIAKIAVMPQSPKDVLRLLSVTYEASRTLSCPLVTMSMNTAGLISRLSGELFGSCLTFGSVGGPSAPGQIDVRELKDILETLHGGASHFFHN